MPTISALTDGDRQLLASLGGGGGFNLLDRPVKEILASLEEMSAKDLLALCEEETSSKARKGLIKAISNIANAKGE